MAKKLLVVLILMTGGLFFLTKQESKEQQVAIPIIPTLEFSGMLLPEEEQIVEEEVLPVGKSTDYSLILVNYDHSFSDDDLTVPLKTLKDGHQVAEEVYEPFQQMLAAAKEAKFDLTVVSSYRSVATQKQVYQNSISDNLAQGSSQTEALNQTEDYVAKPGESEHHTGLALDILETKWFASGKGLEAEFGDTDAGKWIDANCVEYGFIIRYPKNKEEITKIKYEPWHLRYVGKEHAQYMKENNLSFEEYIERLKEVEDVEKEAK